MEKFIHVKAESEVLSVNQLIEEKKAVKFLTGIRNSFEYLKLKYKKTGDKLVVKTCVHNPELDFSAQYL